MGPAVGRYRLRSDRGDRVSVTTAAERERLARSATEAVKVLRELGDHPKVVESINAIVEHERSFGFEAGLAAGERSIDEELDQTHVEIDALVERLEDASRRARGEAWASEPTEGDTTAAERLAAYKHGISAGLAMAATWLRRTQERIPSVDEDVDKEPEE